MLCTRAEDAEALFDEHLGDKVAHKPRRHHAEDRAGQGIADGDKLPSVRALATQLAINPNTIQRAYNELEASGYCCSVPGKGCFAVHTYRAQDDARRLSLEQQLRELLQELRAMGVSEEDIQALCREGEEK